VKPHLDLWSANRDQLIAAGVDASRIHVCGLSTVTHPGVFDSYRVDGERAGRMAGLIVVPGATRLRREA
jgi:copper oxidase (laccase) domain-containing protein